MKTIRNSYSAIVALWLLATLAVALPLLADSPRGVDRLAADEKAARYRTGKIDPAIAKIPERVQQGVFEDPHAHLPVIVDFLVRDTDDDFQKVKRIHDWITHNIAYDNDLFYGIGEGGREAFDALVLRRTTCGGYSKLFAEMIGLAKLETVYIDGYARSYIISRGSEEEPGNHAWNGVKIDGRWYIVDTTLDGRLRYDIRLLTNLSDMLRDIRMVREGNKIISLYDSINAGRDVITLNLECPENVKADAALRDMDGGKLVGHAFSHREGNIEFLHFSAPRKGIFNAYIYARYTDREDLWRTVYSVRLIAQEGQRPELPEAHRLYKLHPFYKYDLKVVEHNLYAAHDYYRLVVEHPQDVSIVSALRDRNDKKVEDRLAVSIIGNRREYYYSTPAAGTFFVKLYAKHKSDTKGFFLTSLVAKVESARVGPTLPPPETLIVSQRFDGNGFRLVSHNVDGLNPDGIYRVVVDRPGEYMMANQLRNRRNNKVYNHYSFDRQDDSYSFYFSVPAEGSYTARIYAIGIDAVWNTVAQFELAGTGQTGPTLPFVDRLNIQNGAYRYGCRILESNISASPVLDGHRGYYKVAIEHPQGVSLVSNMYDSQNNKHPQFIRYSRNGNRKTYYYSAPPDGVYRVKIFAKSQDEVAYNHTVAEFAVENRNGPPGPALPPPAALLLKNRFDDNGFRLVSENINVRNPGEYYTLVVESTAKIAMNAAVRDENNERVRGYYDFKRAGDTYTFYFSDPPQGTYMAKIYQVVNDVWNIVAEFKILGRGGGRKMGNIWQS